jgi:hypothetical protein
MIFQLCVEIGKTKSCVDIGWARISKNSKRVLVFNGLLTRKSPLAAIRKNSLDDDLTFSQDVGKFLANAGVQGLLFKSTVGQASTFLVRWITAFSANLKSKNSTR